MEKNPAAPPSPASGDPFAVFNSEGVYQAYVHTLDGPLKQAQLIVSGIHCAGCVRSIESGLQAAGALEAQVNFGNHRARVVWEEGATNLGEMLRALDRLGYQGHPYDPATQEALHRRESRLSLARLGVAAFGAANVMLFSVGLYAGHYYGIEAEYRELFRWLSALLCLPVVMFSGAPFFRGAWGGLRARRFNMDSLIALGISVTLAYSLVAVLRRSGEETYFDSVVMIVFFLLVGRTLETLAKSRAGNVTERLMGLQVKWATRLENGGERTVPIDAVRPGDLLRVRPGEAVPTDGVVTEGRSTLNESALTGESLPRAVMQGDAVLGGVLNLSAPLVMEARAVGAETVLARICRLVEQARGAKPALERLADRVAAHFVSVILVLAGGTFVFWQWVAPGTAPQSAWVTAISVLIIACPCALGLATPVAVLAGTAQAARRGVMVKGGEVLERAAQVTDVVLDKTGTLTLGEMSVAGVESLGSLPPEGWLPLAAALERLTVHPLAKAIVAHAGTLASTGGLGSTPEVREVAVVPGLGARGRVGEHQVAVGSAEWLERCGMSAGLPVHDTAEPEKGTGETGEVLPETRGETGESFVFVGLDGQAVGRVRLSDPLRPDAARAVAELKRMGIRVHLFSGDRRPAVEAAARAAGIEEARGDMLPDAKLEAVRVLQAQGRVVAMVGDGVNDAPALSLADLSMAVGSGSDASLEAAQVVLLRPRLLGVVETLYLARRTMTIIRGNLALSLAYNAVAVPLAMAGWVIPLLAALAMSSSSLLVVANALRLRWLTARV